MRRGFCLLRHHLHILTVCFFLSLQQLLVGQTATTAPTTTSVSAQSPLSETNPPSLSPNGGTQPGALSPGGLSQTSQNAGTTTASLSNGVVGNGAVGSASTCCENGRPIMTDPVSGQTVCSCQYDSARLALSSYSRLPSAGVYGSPYPSTDQNPYPSIGVDSSAFYSPLVSIKTAFPLNAAEHAQTNCPMKCVKGRLNEVTQQHNFGSLIVPLHMREKNSQVRPMREYNEHLMYSGHGERRSKRTSQDFHFRSMEFLQTTSLRVVVVVWSHLRRHRMKKKFKH